MTDARINLDDFILSDDSNSKHRVFDCLFTGDIIQNAVISPQGTSYNDQDLHEWLTNYSHSEDTESLAGTDPFTRDILTPAMCYPNLHLNAIKHYLIYLLKQPTQDISPLIPLLCCPLSGKLFEEPVVAINGLTYEKKTILKLKTESSPYGALACQPLYQNRFMENFLKTEKMQLILKSISPTLNLSVIHHSFPLIKYIGNRNNEPEFLNFCSQALHFFQPSKFFSKTQKIEATLKLLSALNDYQQANLLIEHPTNQSSIAALKQGRLKEVAKYGLFALKKQRNLKNTAMNLYFHKTHTQGRKA